MTARELEVGKPYILRGLSSDDRPHTATATRVPPTIGKFVGIAGELLLFKLKMGSGRWVRWCPRARRVQPGSVVREASPREVELGIPVGTLPARAS